MLTKVLCVLGAAVALLSVPAHATTTATLEGSLPEPAHTTQPSLVTATFVSGRLKELVPADTFKVTRTGTGRLPGTSKVLYRFRVEYNGYAEDIYLNADGILEGRYAAPH